MSTGTKVKLPRLGFTLAAFSLLALSYLSAVLLYTPPGQPDFETYSIEVDSTQRVVFNNCYSDDRGESYCRPSRDSFYETLDFLLLMVSPAWLILLVGILKGRSKLGIILAISASTLITFQLFYDWAVNWSVPRLGMIGLPIVTPFLVLMAYCGGKLGGAVIEKLRSGKG
jgi:hypothetical protein